MPPLGAEALATNPVTPVAGEVAMAGTAPESVPPRRFDTLRTFWERTVDTAGAIHETSQNLDVRDGARALGETVVSAVALVGRFTEAKNVSKAGGTIKPERAAENRALLGHTVRNTPGNLRTMRAGAKAARATFRKSYTHRQDSRASAREARQSA